MLFAYPWIEKTTGDNAHRCCSALATCLFGTGIGVMGIVFFLLLTLIIGNDLLLPLQISLNAMTWVGRIGLDYSAANCLLPDLPYLHQASALGP